MVLFTIFRILGPLALKELGKNDKELPPGKRRKLTRPVCCYSMKDAIIGIIGFSEEKYVSLQVQQNILFQIILITWLLF